MMVGGRGRFTLRGLLVRFALNAVGLWVAAAIVPGIELEGWESLLAVTAILALVNSLVRPFAFLASACVIILTFGLFIVVLNALMLALTAWFAGELDLDFRIDTFWSALFGAVIVSLVSFFGYVTARAWRLA
jgi:putative membrane protein